jgi:hypothetical protein
MDFEIIDNPPFDSLTSSEAHRVAEWNQLKQELPLGTVLTGRVFARAIYGVFFDSGHGFPVLVRVLDFGRPEGHTQWPEDYPTLGSRISGLYCGVNEGGRQLIVRLLT